MRRHLFMFQLSANQPHAWRLFRAPEIPSPTSATPLNGYARGRNHFFCDVPGVDTVASSRNTSAHFCRGNQPPWRCWKIVAIYPGAVMKTKPLFLFQDVRHQTLTSTWRFSNDIQNCTFIRNTYILRMPVYQPAVKCYTRYHVQCIHRVRIYLYVILRGSLNILYCRLNERWIERAWKYLRLIVPRDIP